MDGGVSRGIGPSWVAGGTVPPSVFVKMSTTLERSVVTAGLGDQVVGVSQSGQRDAPGLTGSDTAVAALVGESLDVYAPGDIAPVTVGSTSITMGDRVMSDASGLAITATTTTLFYNGVAMANGAVGTLVNVWLYPSQRLGAAT